MGSYQYERLSAQDNDFLRWERPNLPMHVAGIQIFEAGPLRNEYGGIDFEKVKGLTESVLHTIPRYRQKVKLIPGTEQAVWIDDDSFNLDYHFRHTSLPRPGTEQQLRVLTARLMEQPLDRSRPLWETWVVEGLSGDRFATVNKIHHCMIDGASGIDLSQMLLSMSPQQEVSAAPRFIPRPEPRDDELKSSERMRRIFSPIETATDFMKFAQQTDDLPGAVMERARALAGLAGWKARPASSTPINGSIGPHRIVDWTTMPLDDMKAVGRALDCKINDIVLTIVTGAIRGLMLRRQVRVGDLDFRVSAPVNTRKPGDVMEPGNHVSSWIVRLPLAEADPLAQLEEIKRETRSRKEDGSAEAVELALTLVDQLGLSVQDMSVGTVNAIVTNVPGPPFPLYMLGAELKAMIGFAPLLDNIGLAVGAISYNGNVNWGLSADYDRLPDLADFCRDLADSFAHLAEAGGVELSKPVAALEAGAESPAADVDAAEVVEPQVAEPAVPVRH